MKVVDLTHTISTETPVFPGTPGVKIKTFATVEKDRFREKLFQITSHVGTHMDAPAHMLTDGRFLDDFPLDAFMGSAVVVDVRNTANKELGPELLDGISEMDFILFRSGWSAKWGSPEYFESYPYPGEALAEALVTRGVKGIGLDTISADAADSHDFKTHHILLQSEILIIENLTNLEALPDTPFEFYAFPLKTAQADGDPVRAVAIIR